MQISHLDHLVLTVQNIERTCNFYTTVLGMLQVEYGNGRYALQFGHQKINLHQVGKEFEPKAKTALPGTADLCFILQTNLNEAIDHLTRHHVPILSGPVPRTGANGPMQSIYLRDPDENLIELSVYDAPSNEQL